MMYAITGIGVWDCLGDNLDTNFKKLVDKDYVDNYSVRVDGHPKVDPCVHMSIKTTRDAVRQAGWDVSDYTDVPVISSSIFSGGHSWTVTHNQRNLGKRASIKSLLSAGQNFISTAISKEFKFVGTSFNAVSSCTAGLTALEIGCMHIDKGYDKVLINSVDTMSEIWMDGYNEWFFKALGAWSSDGNVKPFDIDRSGIKIGDGSVSMAIEPLEKARSRGAKILAIIEQIESAVDSDHVTQPSKDARGTKVMMDKLYNTDVDYVNAHGTATPIGDLVEYTNMQRYYKEGTPMTSFKGAIGHCMGASGLIELAYTVKVMETNTIPPSPNLHKPLGKHFDFVLDKPIQREINRAQKNGFGFGGRCATVLLRKEKG